MSVKDIDKQYVANTYNRFPIEIVSGKGSVVMDDSGKEYIDMGSGIGVTSFGLCDDVWLKAVVEQASKLQHMSNLYYTEPCALLAKMLCEKTGMKKVFFSNSGAEANECAIKAARKYSQQKKGREYSTVVTLENSFHGRTLTTLAATGQEHYHELFTPLTPGFVHTKANDFEALKAVCGQNKTAGIMLECIQGEGGVVPLSQDFVDEIFDLCAKKDILTIADEVQTGVGRTGKFLAGDNFGHKADISTLAKGIAGGIPMGACLADEKCADVLGKGTHGSTFGGNPIACAGGNAVLDFISDEKNQKEVAEKGKYLREKLLEISEITSVDGMGLMLGAALKTKSAADVVKAALDKGLLLLTAKEKVRFLPPLTITYEEIDKGISILKDILEK